MAQRVVDSLEPVHVEKQHREAAAGPVGARDGLLQPLHQRAPVVQPGQRVTRRQAMRPFLRLAAFDDLGLQGGVGFFQVLHPLHLQVAVKFGQFLRLALQLQVLPGEVYEHRDLVLQYLRNDGGEQIVHRALLVALEPVHFVGVVRGDENDRHRSGTWMGMDDLRSLEAIHARHADVEKDDRKLLLQHLA
jgi:hypothetical protein